MEVIVVDDGSTDGTPEFLRERYGDRIRYVWQANRRQGAARNNGIRHARYDLIAFLDSDDSWLPSKLSDQVPLMADPGVVLGYTNWITIAGSSEVDCFHALHLKLEVAPAIIDEPLQWLLRPGGCGILTSTCLVRKEAVLRCGGFDERLKIAEDTYLWLKLAQMGKFAVLPRPLARRCVTGQDDQVSDLNRKTVLQSSIERTAMFWDTYAHGLDQPSQIQRDLRERLAVALIEQAREFARRADHKQTRRKAKEALAFASEPRSILKAMVGLLCPRVLVLFSKE